MIPPNQSPTPSPSTPPASPPSAEPSSPDPPKEDPPSRDEEEEDDDDDDDDRTPKEPSPLTLPLLPRSDATGGRSRDPVNGQGDGGVGAEYRR